MALSLPTAASVFGCGWLGTYPIPRTYGRGQAGGYAAAGASEASCGTGGNLGELYGWYVALAPFSPGIRCLWRL